jgi:hypothetical protein
MQMTPALRADFRRALLATLCFGAAAGIFQSTLNNYLADVHGFGAESRGWLEFPRELPGFLMIVIAGAMLLRLRETQMAAAAMLLTALGAFGRGVYVIGKTLLYGDPVRGYPTLVVLVLFAGGLQLMALGIIGEYLARMFVEVKGRPLYLVQRSLPPARPLPPKKPSKRSPKISLNPPKASSKPSKPENPWPPRLWPN